MFFAVSCKKYDKKPLDIEQVTPFETVDITIGGTKVHLTVAKTNVEKARITREVVVGKIKDVYNGVLYVFGENSPLTFRQKKTDVATDIAFLDKNGTVLQIEYLPPTPYNYEQGRKMPYLPPNQNYDRKAIQRYLIASASILWAFPKSSIGDAKFILHLPGGFLADNKIEVGSKIELPEKIRNLKGEQEKPVLLKRGWAATLEEFLLAAEYIISRGNDNVILCERGIRTHEQYVRNTLPLAVVPAVRRLSHLPIIVDPSQGTGHSYMVPDMCRASVAVGADGLLIEVHPDPEHALTDGAQSITPEQFAQTMESLRKIAAAVGREI